MYSKTNLNIPFKVWCQLGDLKLDGGGDDNDGDCDGDWNGLEPVSSNNTLTKTKIQSISMLLMCLYLCDSTVFSSNL